MEGLHFHLKRSGNMNRVATDVRRWTKAVPKTVRLLISAATEGQFAETARSKLWAHRDTVTVAQTSQSPVSRVSKPAKRRPIQPCRLEIGDTAGLSRAAGRATPLHSRRLVAESRGVRKLSEKFGIVVCTLGFILGIRPGSAVPAIQQGQANVVVEIPFQATQPHPHPFTQVNLDVIFTDPAGQQKTVPAFWAGADTWKVRYASSLTGTHRYRSDCSVKDDPGLHGVEGRLEIKPYTGQNPLYRHGPIRVATDGRHFAHTDGTPFFWLADTWWKCLCKRMTWEGFQELTADRQAKGFSVVQIVCGPYPDEGAFEPRWENEGGKPYETRDFSVVNPAYFDYADRRFKHLVDAGIVPAIVGAWGRADCNSMEFDGPEGLKRHWRHLVARYGAYPVFWILAGEIPDGTKWGEGPWADVARYLRRIDPYHHPLTCHTGQGRRGLPGDDVLIDFDMVGGNHYGPVAIKRETLSILSAAYAKTPSMPVLCGETAYEGHMQNNFQDVQRHVFWMYMLSGAAGHTYGAAGVWHASAEGDPGITPVYDWTTWKEGMNYPGSTQLGLGKKLLEAYPWWRFEPRPEWVETGAYAAGIPGEVRFIYLPKRGIYNWTGPTLKNLERDVPYAGFYFDPATGRRFDIKPVMNVGRPAKPVEGQTQRKIKGQIPTLLKSGEYQAPPLPSPQDWVLVLERVK
jgi:Protein of unknown function (DUF4038)/Domain of unknown function (DUF5060)